MKKYSFRKPDRESDLTFDFVEEGTVYTMEMWLEDSNNVFSYRARRKNYQDDEEMSLFCRNKFLVSYLKLDEDNNVLFIHGHNSEWLLADESVHKQLSEKLLQFLDHLDNIITGNE